MKTLRLLTLVVTIGIHVACSSPSETSTPTASVSPTPCAFAGSWSTADNYQYVTTTGTAAYGVLLDSSSNVYVTGYGTDATASISNRWLTRKLLAGQSTWANVDNLNVNTTTAAAIGISLGVNSTGELFSAGRVYDGGVLKYRYVVRKSTDAGSTWSSVNTYYYGTQTTLHHTLQSMKLDSSGNIYTIGNGLHTSGGSHSVLLKSTDGGTNFAVVDDTSDATYTFLTGYGVAFGSTGKVFAIMTTADASGFRTWVVKSSSDGSASSFSGVDSYQMAANKAAEPLAIAVDSNGVIYVTGYAKNSSNIEKLITRKSSDQGVTWTVVDDYEYASGYNSRGQAITIGKANDIIVSGYGNASDGSAHWVVRHSVNGGTTWSSLDDYQLSSGQGAVSNSLTADSSGNLWVTGYGIDSSSVRHWITRKLECGS